MRLKYQVNLSGTLYHKQSRKNSPGTELIFISLNIVRHLETFVLGLILLSQFYNNLSSFLY